MYIIEYTLFVFQNGFNKKDFEIIYVQFVVLNMYLIKVIIYDY